VGSGVGAVRIYAGDVPLRDASGTTLGYGRVQVAAARQTLFRGETPAILRSTSHAGFESFHREVALAEYRDGALVPSEGVTLPLGSILPPSIRDRLESAPQHGLWVHERQEGRHLETYYMRGDEERTRVVALSMESPGLQWHVAGLLRILAACSLLLLTGAAIALTRFLTGGGRPIFRFRHRLLGAFLLLSVLPMTGVLLYVQWFAGERLIERTSRELSEETRDIVGRVTPVLGTSFDRRPSVDREVEGIAVDRNTDFNLYLGEELLSSSAPTLYEAGILDRRLNAEAYRTVVLDRHPFVMQRERVGEYRFAVGYRALMDSVGTVLAVIAVPTVFRQEDLDREIAGTTTFVAALGIVVLLFVVVAAAAIAHTIAAPIQDLTEATARVTRGDLDAVVKQGHAGGELGVLVRAFERMTHDLKSSRDALIRYERELAWKEMAKQVAHEINNPLTPMKLLLQHLGKAYRDGAEDFGELLDRVLRTVIGQIDQLGRIAAEFSHFARMPKRIVEPSSLRQIINEVVDLYSKEPRVRFSITAPESLPSVRVDRDELRRAFINVIRNGVQAMSGEGVIEIRAALSGAGIAVEIRDQGPGMPEEVRLRAFDAGFTTKKGGSGVGLGLVRSTMEELGGTVTLASTPGEGTTVTLWIPLGPVETEGGAS
jgi:signal transduction histidine kinase